MLYLLFFHNLFVLFIFLLGFQVVAFPPIQTYKALLWDVKHLEIINHIPHPRCPLQIINNFFDKRIFLNDILIQILP